MSQFSWGGSQFSWGVPILLGGSQFSWGGPHSLGAPFSQGSFPINVHTRIGIWTRINICTRIIGISSDFGQERASESEASSIGGTLVLDKTRVCLPDERGRASIEVCERKNHQFPCPTAVPSLRCGHQIGSSHGPQERSRRRRRTRRLYAALVAISEREDGFR